jgi:hypothetical protein
MLVVEEPTANETQRISSQEVVVAVNSGTEVVSAVGVTAGVVERAELLPFTPTLAVLVVKEMKEAAIVGRPSIVELEPVDELIWVVELVPMVNGEIIQLELVVVDERVGDVEVDVFMIRLGKSMLLEILEETRLDVVTRLEDDCGVGDVVAFELIEVVLLVLDEGFELVEAF